MRPMHSVPSVIQLSGKACSGGSHPLFSGSIEPPSPIFFPAPPRATAVGFRLSGGPRIGASLSRNRGAGSLMGCRPSIQVGGVVHHPVAEFAVDGAVALQPLFVQTR